MDFDTIEIKADKDFLDDARAFFQSQGVNIQEMILSYISFRMNSDETQFVQLIELTEEEITPDIKAALEEANKTPKEERISFKENRHAF